VNIAVRIAAFPGSDEERLALAAAVRRNCACRTEAARVLPDPCATHDLLRLESTLKHLVFYRRWHRARRDLP
jgi:hypothetical protein